MSTIVYDGFRFPEGARWRDGRLWFSDMHTGEVFRADPVAGTPPETVARIDDQPSGLGWSADGSLLISSMTRRLVVRVDPDGVHGVFADLSGFTDAPINDLVVDGDGRVYVGGFGYDLYGDAPQRPGPIFVLEPAGDARVARDDLVFPNGSVVLPGSRTLVVAETWAARLTAFTITGDGDLVDRRVWAPLPAGATPDGLCVDAEHGVWVADISNGRFLRVTEGGEVTDEIDVGDRAPADCVLGGRTLYLLTANSWQPSETGIRAGRVEAVEVSVPGP
ncbi:SMP-30/gluconolactonase/LRE family protein [Cryptosporangium arvum]|uniref:Gluconolactonase n=1 Tax=Cryptosporangium arvum DSM 44712 TaxID=927661 RepID=A0A010Z5Z4_9ACTN|nr:SMP-30/gluconolactonase/LRE family protein [Cryptosporangium arvum]EXG82733.1 gluconolactonase [Cryptosporangium arvum DSM 44712]